MPSYISKEGVFHPAKEIVALTNYGPDFVDPNTKRIVKNGQPYIYEGPCRAALFELWESYGKPSKNEMKDKAKEMTMGTNFRKSPEFLQMLRDLNFKSADEYLAWIGYDATKVEEDFKEKASVVTTHDAPQRVAEIKRVGGGDNKASPGKDVKYGGFGEPSDLVSMR